MAGKINMEEFIRVTAANRETAVVIGRVIHLIKNKRDIGKILVRPKLKKGHFRIENDPHAKVKNYSEKIMRDETQDEWIHAHKPVIDHVISQGIAYIKTMDTIISYSQ